MKNSHKGDHIIITLKHNQKEKKKIAQYREQTRKKQCLYFITVSVTAWYSRMRFTGKKEKAEDTQMSTLRNVTDIQNIPSKKTDFAIQFERSQRDTVEDPRGPAAAICGRRGILKWYLPNN